MLITLVRSFLFNDFKLFDQQYGSNQRESVYVTNNCSIRTPQWSSQRGQLSTLVSVETIKCPKKDTTEDQITLH